MADVVDIIANGAVNAAGEAVSLLAEHKSVWGKFTQRVSNIEKVWPRIYIARGFGEAASMASAPVATVLVENLAGKPYDDLKTRISKKWIEPNLDWWDEKLANAKSLDTPEERRERHILPRDQQACKITDLIVDQFGVKFGGSLVGQFFTQDYFMRKFGAPVSPGKNGISIAVDRGVQLGSMVVLNSIASDQAIKAQESLVKVLKKSGMEEEKAEEWANYAVNFTGPNLLAYLASSEVLTRFAKKAL